MPEGRIPNLRVLGQRLRVRVATSSLPPVPTGLSASTISSSSISVSWTASVGATGYVLQRSPDNATWSTIASPTGTTYSDTGFTASTTYYYRIAARNLSGQSAYSSSANATTSASGAVPPNVVRVTPNGTDWHPAGVGRRPQRHRLQRPAVNRQRDVDDARYSADRLDARRNCRDGPALPGYRPVGQHPLLLPGGFNGHMGH